MSTDTATTPADPETLPFRYSAALAGQIERRWQDYWVREGTFNVPNPAGPWAAPMPAGEKVYLLDMFPYPSGDLHMGHAEAYAIADAIAHLGRCKVAIHCGPDERFGAKGPGTSVYFRDPDGSLLEFISYDRGANS